MCGISSMDKWGRQLRRGEAQASGTVERTELDRNRHGGGWMPLSMPRWNGLTGSTIADYWSPLEMFHQQNEKGRTIVNWRSQVKLPDSNKLVSGITGVVHFGLVANATVRSPAIRRLEFVAFRFVVLIVHEDLLVWRPSTGATTEPDRWQSVCSSCLASRSPGLGRSACLAEQFRRWRKSIGPARSGGS